jgi:hypothetical protein
MYVLYIYYRMSSIMQTPFPALGPAAKSSGLHTKPGNPASSAMAGIRRCPRLAIAMAKSLFQMSTRAQDALASDRASGRCHLRVRIIRLRFSRRHGSVTGLVTS